VPWPYGHRRCAGFAVDVAPAQGVYFARGEADGGPEGGEGETEISGEKMLCAERGAGAEICVDGVAVKARCTCDKLYVAHCERGALSRLSAQGLELSVYGMGWH